MIVGAPLGPISRVWPGQLTAAADTGLTAGTEATIGVFDMSATRQHAGNTGIAAERLFRFIPGTESFAGGAGTGTITDAATVGIAGGPTGGTNAKITNSHALFISTIAYNSVTNGYGLTVNAPTGATNNYAANIGGVKFDSVSNLTNAKSYAVSAGNVGLLYAPKYISNDWYWGLLPGQTSNATNTTPFVNDTTYAMPAIAWAPLTIKAVAMRTSSSSASVGASLKACVYAGDGTNGAPGTLLASTTSGTAVTDSAANTNISFTLDSPAVVPPGIFYIAFLQTSSTGIRPNIVSGSIPASQFMGGTSVAIMGGTNVIYGYTNSQSYASGCDSSFGTATAQTSINLAESTTFQVN